MSEPANFGNAKSMFLSGISAGYDMTTEQRMAQHITAYNQSLQSDVVSSPMTPVSERKRLAGTITFDVEVEKSSRVVAPQ